MLIVSTRVNTIKCRNVNVTQLDAFIKFTLSHLAESRCSVVNTLSECLWRSCCRHEVKHVLVVLFLLFKPLICLFSLLAVVWPSSLLQSGRVSSSSPLIPLTTSLMLSTRSSQRCPPRSRAMTTSLQWWVALHLENSTPCTGRHRRQNVWTYIWMSQPVFMEEEHFHIQQRLFCHSWKSTGVTNWCY